MFKAKKRCCLAAAFGKTLEGAEGHWAINVQAVIGKAPESAFLLPEVLFRRKVRHKP
jgi:hypothetical protein